METFEATIKGVDFAAFQSAIESPRTKEINNATPEFLPAMIKASHATDMETLKAYMRYQLLTKAAGRLPKQFDQENFDFYGRKLYGQPEQAARWKRCSNSRSEERRVGKECW